MTEDTHKKPLGIYFHWGFCLSKCPYCDFMSKPITDLSSFDFSAWLAEYKKALSFYFPLIKNHQIRSIFFGGGTPSLLPTSFVAELINYLAANANLAPKLEISLEANPSSSSLFKFTELKNAGINRLSLGIQSFSDDVLHFLGRIHSANEAKLSLQNALKVFSNVSFDMIYAYPEHEKSDWEHQLSEALTFPVQHISLYQLTIEKGCSFYRQKIKPLAEDEAADLFALTYELTTAQGMPPYEVSNHARSNHACIHNLGYWHYEDYLGIGPSAHGRINGIATEQTANPLLWFKQKNKNCVFTTLSEIEKQEEKLLMGLRLYEGIDDSFVPAEKARDLVAAGYLKRENRRLCPTLKGMLVLNHILYEILG